MPVHTQYTATVSTLVSTALTKQRHLRSCISRSFAARGSSCTVLLSPRPLPLLFAQSARGTGVSHQSSFASGGLRTLPRYTHSSGVVGCVHGCTLMNRSGFWLKVPGDRVRDTDALERGDGEEGGVLDSRACVPKMAQFCSLFLV